MNPAMRPTTCAGRVIVLLVVALAMAGSASAQTGDAPAVSDTDSLYTARHPRLLFSRSEIAALRAKVHDGGADDRAYAYVHQLVDSLYPISSLGDLMNQTYGMNVSLNAGLVIHVDQPPDEVAMDVGRRFTIAVADSFAPDDNVFYSPVRLRILCLGYDLCMDRATPTERAYVRGEIESYVDTLMMAFNYERWLHRPYTSNITAMIGSSLGLAAICLSDEIAPARVRAALARADTFVAVWKRYQLDPGGAYREGVQYGTWSMRHLPAYFEARRRYDGMDYSRDPAIRGIERWLAYELLPEAGGAVNNLNDTAYLNWPLARHNTYLDWAMSAWSGGLSAWIWERALGPNGHDWGILGDRASTVLWWRPIVPQSPSGRLPNAVLWPERGLYYYRTGWPTDEASDDVVFSFYSGKFEGGHSQEDQNSFTLYGFGARFAADNGFDAVNAVSAAHNMVFVDGLGQHHSGASVGTDGWIAGRVLANYGDYVFGDATQAYATYSPFNEPGYPFPDDDWSYGYGGSNPVLRAHRRWIVVHDGPTPPYFVLLDDIQKDELVRTYDWRMHTEATHDVDVSGDDMVVTAPRGSLVIDIVSPARSEVVPSVEAFANPSADPDTKVLVLSQSADAGRFALVLRPTGDGQAPPLATHTSAAWGGAEALEWPNGPIDVVFANPDRDTVTVSLHPTTAPDLPEATTDARLGQMRFRGGSPDGYVLVDVTTFRLGSEVWAQVEDGPLTIVYDGKRVDIDRENARFTLYAPLVTEIRYRGARLLFDRQGDFVSRGADTPTHPPSALVLHAYPSPFQSAVTVVMESPEPASADVTVHDVSGRLVRQVWRGSVAVGRTFTSWDGHDDRGERVASGVYFVRARTGADVRSAKIVLVR
jgi:FlgD Ig-like domain